MAVGLPLKTTYADGDVYSASDVNDTNGTINITAAPYAAGKNKIINGDFYVNQRAFTSNTASDTYNFDRWVQLNGGSSGTLTITPQTFTVGTAPVTGYEGKNFIQCVTASGASADTYSILAQKIESVRTLAGQTATISFWAKATSGTPKIGVEIEQFFGTGGSPSSEVRVAGGAVTLSTSWARYSVTVAVPSISGKTIGTSGSDQLGVFFWFSAGSTFASRASSIGLQNATFQMWGVQVEQGSTATAFQTATGTLQGELAACQRYLPVFSSFEAYGYTYTTNAQVINIPFLVQPRVAPTGITLVGTFILYNSLNSGTTITPTFNGAGLQCAGVLGSGTGTAGTPARLQPQSNSAILFTGCEL